jgi:hypothetical protein
MSIGDYSTFPNAGTGGFPARVPYSGFLFYRTDWDILFSANKAGVVASTDWNPVTRNAYNYIINGDFSVNRRKVNNTNVSVANGANVYVIDRWLVVNTAGVTMNVQTTYLYQGYLFGQTDNYRNYDTPNYINLATTANVANSGTKIRTKIESVRTLSGKAVTLSGWVYGGVASQTFQASLIQDFGTGSSPHAAVTYTGPLVNVTQNAWNFYEYNFILGNITGFGLGTDGLDNLNIALLPNPATTTAINQSYTNWQLEESASYTKFHKRPFAVELELCKRYYQNTFPYGILPAPATGYTNCHAWHSTAGASAVEDAVPYRLEKEMFRAPTLLFYNPLTAGNFQARDNITSTDGTAITQSAITGTKQAAFYSTLPSGNVAGHLQVVHMEMKGDYNDPA